MAVTPSTGFRADTHNTHIYVAGSELAVYVSLVNVVISKLSNPITGSGWQETDPLGGYVGFADPFQNNPNTTYDSLHPSDALYLEDGNPFDPGGGCTLDGLPVSCAYAEGRRAAGGVALAPLGDTVAQWANGQWEFRFFHAFADGTEGYMPLTATLGNNGFWHYPGSDFGGRLSGQGGGVGYENRMGATPVALQQNSSSGGIQLTLCLRDALRQFFPEQSAQGNKYSPVDDARFKAGIPGWMTTLADITPGSVTPKATTLGLYDIHYDTQKMSISGGSNESLKAVIEEVSHAEQFINLWANLRNDPMLLYKYGTKTTDYAHAQDEWKLNYAYYSVKGGSYDNDVERKAKENADRIMNTLKATAKQHHQWQICGFTLFR